MTDQDSRVSARLAWVAGAAFVALVAILVFAVVRTSRDATLPDGLVPPAQSSAVTTRTPAATSPKTSSKTSPTTRSYGAPSVQTSEDSAPVVTGPPAEVPPVDDSPSPTSTTIFNPYVTTTPPAADGV